LLLDLREPSEYEASHIIESLNFPGPKVCQDKVPPEIYRFVVLTN